MQKIGDWCILRWLGDGCTGKVHLAQDKEASVKVAIKSPDLSQIRKTEKIADHFQNEFNILSKLSHPHIVKALQFKEEADCEHSDSESGVFKAPMLAIEFCENGDLCNLICATGAFSEKCTRFYFSQLLQVLKYMHSESITHRDIKMENMMLDENFDLKLIDFTFASVTPSKTILTTGTPGYMAPEIYEKMPSCGFKTDLFAAGVVLFIMIKGVAPFGDASPEDPRYTLFSSSSHKYWKYIEANKQKEKLPVDLRTLIEGLLCSNPDKRWTLEQVLTCDWMRKTTTKAEILEEIKSKVTNTNLSRKH